MKLHLLLGLLILGGCATKYIVPGNRFITPETQGGAFKGQFELQQTGATQLTIDTSKNDVKHGVTYEEVVRTGFLFSNSFFEIFDVLWSHTGSSTSMLGGKLQLMGSSRTAKGTGHKLALAALFGGNDHETDDKSVEFELSGKEYMILYGYRISDVILPYASLSLETYNFNGKIHSNDPFLNGLEPKLVTKATGLNSGIEFTMGVFFAKLEASYQQLKTTDTKDKDRFMFGYSLGYSW